MTISTQMHGLRLPDFPPPRRSVQTPVVSGSGAWKSVTTHCGPPVRSRNRPGRYGRPLLPPRCRPGPGRRGGLKGTTRLPGPSSKSHACIHIDGTGERPFSDQRSRHWRQRLKRLTGPLSGYQSRSIQESSGRGPRNSNEGRHGKGDGRIRGQSCALEDDLAEEIGHQPWTLR